MNDIVIKGTIEAAEDVEEIAAEALEAAVDDDIEEVITRRHVRAVEKYMRTINRKLDELPKLESMMVTVTGTQRSMSQALESFAATFKRSQDQFQELVKMILDKDKVPENHVPIKIVGKLILLSQIPTVVMAICVVAAALFFAKIDVEGSLSKLKLTTNANSQRLDKVEPQVEDTKKEVEKVAEVQEMKEKHGDN